MTDASPDMPEAWLLNAPPGRSPRPTIPAAVQRKASSPKSALEEYPATIAPLADTARATPPEVPPRLPRKTSPVACVQRNGEPSSLSESVSMDDPTITEPS